MAKENVDKAKYTEPVYLLIDEPVGSIEEDILSLKPFADVIAGAAMGTEGPFTIGVYADWGEGKTSVLRLAKDLVEYNAPEIVTVWFNAWQYGKEEHPIVPLVSTIAKSIGDKLVEKDTTISDKVKSGMKKMSSALRAIAYGFSAKGKVSVPGFADIEAGFVAKEMIERYDKLQKGEDPLIEKTLYYNAFETLESMSKQTDDEIESPRIAVFIDDLDRCNPPEAIKLLESIKLVLSQKGFVFALALDKRVLQGFLKYRYEKEFKVEKYSEGGKDYLDKIIQLPLPLLSHEKRFEGYIEKLLDNNIALNHKSNQSVKEAISNLKEVLAKGAMFNPRNLVRFLNNLIVDRLLWKTTDSGEANTEIMGFCVVSRILRDHFKDDRLYDHLWKNQSVCDAVRRFVFKEKEPDEREDVAKDTMAGGAEGKKDQIKEIKTKLIAMVFLQDVFETEPGRKWLEDKSKRYAVNEFIVEQREEEPERGELDDEKIVEEVIRKIVRVRKGVIEGDHYKCIYKLKLNGKGLKVIPEVIGELKSLYTLYLDSNELITLPARIGELKTLEKLYMSHNLLSSLPEVIGELTNLQVLYLDGNVLSSLSARIGDLKSLKTLYLSGNKLSTLPAGIGKLKSLDRLDLGGNQFRSLPSAICELTSLRWLYLSENKLRQLPARIGGLTSLQMLYLSNNQLSLLPKEIGKLTSLEGLYLQGNDFSDEEQERIRGMVPKICEVRF